MYAPATGSPAVPRTVPLTARSAGSRIEARLLRGDLHGPVSLVPSGACLHPPGAGPQVVDPVGPFWARDPHAPVAALLRGDLHLGEALRLDAENAAGEGPALFEADLEVFDGGLGRFDGEVTKRISRPGDLEVEDAGEREEGSSRKDQPEPAVSVAVD